MKRILKFGCLSVIGVFALLMVAGALASSGAKHDDQAAPAGAPSQEAVPEVPAPTVAPSAVVGVPYASGNWEYTVHDVKRMKTIGSGFLKEEAKGEFVVVGLTLKNIGKENFGVHTWDFELRDANGVQYDPASVFAGDEWAKSNGYTGGLLSLGSGQMPPGVPIKYGLVFDTAPGAQGLKLHLEQASVDVALP
ncbi:MAG: DUF4352 domain-containing protein [Chloroflexota bacterium]